MKTAFVLAACLCSSFALAQEAQERPKELNALDFLVGKFTLDPTVKTEDTSTAVGGWILAKQHLKVDVSGTMMGMKMEGMMVINWDDQAKTYTVTWFDSMAGGVITGTGGMKDGALTTLTPMIEMMGQKTRIRTVLTRTKDGFKLNVGMGDNDKFETFVDHTYIRAK